MAKEILLDASRFNSDGFSFHEKFLVKNSIEIFSSKSASQFNPTIVRSFDFKLKLFHNEILLLNFIATNALSG